MEVEKPRYEGAEHFESTKEIEQIKNTKWNCKLMGSKADCGEIGSACCVNCPTFNDCKVICRHSERWVISDQTCVFAFSDQTGIFATNNCKKTEKEG